MLRAPFTLVGNLIYLIRFVISQAIWRLVKLFQKDKQYVQIDVSSDLPFGRHKIERYFAEGPTFLEFREFIKSLAKDNSVEGVVLRFEGNMSRSKNADFLEAVSTLRESGKKVIGHTDQGMMNTLANLAQCDEAVVSPASRFYAFGGRIENYFMKPLFEKVGVSAQFFHIGEFKTATSRFVRNEMSPSEKAMMMSLLHGLESNAVDKIATGRKLTTETVNAVLDTAPLEPRKARRASLIDGEAFQNSLAMWIRHGDEFRHGAPPSEEEESKPHIQIVHADDFAQPMPFQWRPLFRRPKYIALMDLTGAISHPGQGSERGIVSKDVIPVLRRLRSNRRVAGVILHINSPGGSALASDLMWNEIDRLRAEKPVVAYLGDVAASGGYYLAVGADRIVCRPETITGSIGVITGKVSFGEAVEKLINVDSVQERKSGDVGSVVEPLDDDLRANFEREIRSAYRRFLERVGIARNIPKRRLHRFARGRVYLGDQAKARGLVDEIGGFDKAIEVVQQLIEKDGGKAPSKVGFHAHTKPNVGALLRKNAMSTTLGRWMEKSVVEMESDLSLVVQETPVTLMYCPIRVTS